jgi:hypothetical protein
MAASVHQPDQWSDHDFLILAADKAADFFRSESKWLPDHEAIVLHFSETEHGVKVLYADGHLLEFAVITAADFHLARMNSHRVLIDRDGFGERVARSVADTAAWAADDRKSDAWLLGQFLTHLLVGVGRYARGEHISGRRIVKDFVLGDLLQLLARHRPPEAEGHLDSLDAYRRFEQAYPALGEKVNAALEAPMPQAALALLDLMENELAGLLDQQQKRAAQVVRQKMLDELD